MTIDSLKSIDGLDTHTGLSNCMDDEQLYSDVIAMFVVQIEQDLPVIKQFYNNQDWLELGKACHGLKGAAASVGASAVQKQSAEFEKAGKNRDVDFISSHFDSYIQLIERTKADIQACL